MSTIVARYRDEDASDLAVQTAGRDARASGHPLDSALLLRFVLILVDANPNG